jgi:type II secretory pathway pseudopilin PulG
MKKKESGITLIALIVMIVIIVILGAVTIRGLVRRT